MLDNVRMLDKFYSDFKGHNCHNFLISLLAECVCTFYGPSFIVKNYSQSNNIKKS